jgi:hypothetical protein
MLSVGIHLHSSGPRLPGEVSTAKIWCDFQSGLYFSQGQPRAFADLFNCSRATSGWFESKAQFPANTPRIGPRGLLIENARTNYVLNSFAPANQSLTLAAGTYAVSTGAGGSVTINGVTALPGTPATFTLASGATLPLTVSSNPAWVQVEAGPYPTSPISTANAPATRGLELVSALTTAWFNPIGCTVKVEWEQTHDGGLDSSNRNLVRWQQGAYFSRLRTGSVTYAQISDGVGGLALNSGASPATVLGVHNMSYTATPTGTSVSWSSSLDGSGGTRTGTTPPGSGAVSSFVFGHPSVDAALNGWLRRVVVL